MLIFRGVSQIFKNLPSKTSKPLKVDESWIFQMVGFLTALLRSWFDCIQTLRLPHGPCNPLAGEQAVLPRDDIEQWKKGDTLPN